MLWRMDFSALLIITVIDNTFALDCVSTGRGLKGDTEVGKRHEERRGGQKREEEEYLRVLGTRGGNGSVLCSWVIRIGYTSVAIYVKIQKERKKEGILLVGSGVEVDGWGVTPS